MTLAAMLTAVLLAGPARAQAAPDRPWKGVHARLSAARDEMSSHLEALRAKLLERARAERPDLLPKLEPEPPKPLPTGYGLLPEVLADEPEEQGGLPSERRYDLAELADWLTRELGYVAELSAKARYAPGDLAPVVEGYLLRAENFRRIDGHVAYHAFWQPEAVKSAEFFQGRNGLLSAYRLWSGKEDGPSAEPRRAEARRRLEDALIELRPTPSLAFEERVGWRVLKVRVATDVADEAFLKAFVRGVEKTWNHAPAMQKARLRVEIVWDRVDPKNLYPDGPPARGSAVDLEAHVRRFGTGVLVLTTGAASTHAWPGRAILLGTQPTTPRTLAHEFSHWLGFQDGYLRAFEGSPDGPTGVVFLEITPFPDDLLSSPARGRVTDAMARKLAEAYSPPPPAAAPGPR